MAVDDSLYTALVCLPTPPPSLPSPLLPVSPAESALLWQYRDADPEFGHMQSKELEDHLNGVLRGYPVEILRGENNPMQVRAFLGIMP